MFQGLATISFYADDLVAAAHWYTELLGVEPYYVFPAQPAPAAYIEFRVGGDHAELGFIDRKYAPSAASSGSGGAVAFWHVDDLSATVKELVAMGASEYEPLTERESGFATASFIDPFGNILGVMTNPHFLEMRTRRNSV